MPFVTDAVVGAHPFDFECATILADAVRGRTRMAVRSRMTSWADEFAKLRELDGVTQRRIRSALDWYCGHVGERYVPVAFSAQAFRKKFARIELARERIGD